MEYNRRPLPDIARLLNPESAASSAVDSAGRVLRRLIPFPSSADTSSLQMPLMQVRNLISPSIVPGEVPPAAGQQSATIVSEAASILDEEMAKGVLAARSVKPYPHRDADQRNTVLRQVHDVIDNVARIWPTVQSVSPQWSGASVATANTASDDALPTLKPASVVRPGERCTISMVLHNEEDRPVRLTPILTDLIAGTGARISSQLFEFVPGDVTLEPGEQRELQVRLVVPTASAVGCYVGLLVLAGVEYLRALIAIEVG